jgi:DNA-directed RNA polymerase subunit RPC12/RpoP
MSAREKIAYLRGLIEGQNLSENVGLSKFHEALLGALDALAEEADAISDAQDDLRDFVEDLDEEVMCIHSEYDPDLMERRYALDDGDDEDEEDEEEKYENTTCPACGRDFAYQPDAYDEDEDLLCPHCGQPFKQ